MCGLDCLVGSKGLKKGIVNVLCSQTRLRKSGGHVCDKSAANASILQCGKRSSCSESGALIESFGDRGFGDAEPNGIVAHTSI